MDYRGAVGGLMPAMPYGWKWPVQKRELTGKRRHRIVRTGLFRRSEILVLEVEIKATRVHFLDGEIGESFTYWRPACLADVSEDVVS